MNSISFAGRLGQDAEMKDINGTALLKFSVASDTGFGEKKSTNWFNCDLWGKQATALEQYMIKGTQVMIVGELTLRQWGEGEKKGMSPDVRVNGLKLIGARSEGNVSSPADTEDDDDAPF